MSMGFWVCWMFQCPSLPLTGILGVGPLISVAGMDNEAVSFSDCGVHLLVLVQRNKR